MDVTQTAIITYDIIKDGFSQCENLPRLCHNYFKHITDLCDVRFRHEVRLAADCLSAGGNTRHRARSTLRKVRYTFLEMWRRMQERNKYVHGFENGVSAVGSEFCAVRSVSVLVPSEEEMHTALE